MALINGNGNGVATHNGNGNSAKADIPVDWEQLARATAHPLRVAVLEILGLDGGRTLSPSDLSLELQIPLSNTNYHVTELAKASLIELTGTRPVRGATEHFYRLPKKRDANDNGRRRGRTRKALARPSYASASNTTSKRMQA